jgi:deazaflavin-dependent oxidoreductase (nitroreductase family)
MGRGRVRGIYPRAGSDQVALKFVASRKRGPEPAPGLNTGTAARRLSWVPAFARTTNLNLPGWMVEHANRYLSSGGTDEHRYKPTQPGRPDITVPSLLLTTTGGGRRSEVGREVHLPAVLRQAGNAYFVVALKGGAPQHPGWHRNLLSNPDVEVQAGIAKMTARARTATGEERAAIRGPHRNTRGHATPSLLKSPPTGTTAPTWWSSYAAPRP